MALLFSAVSAAQTATADQARMYLDMKDYKKAISLYEDLYKKDGRNQEVYNGYLDALLAAKEYKDAEKLVNNQWQKNPSNAAMPVDMGKVLQAAGKEKAAEEY